MKRIPIQTGSVVLSKAGRDEGRAFLVLQEIDDDFVCIADGKTRSVDKLKTKRRKHLKPTGRVEEELVSRLEQGKPVFDHEVRAWLSKEEG